MLCLLDDVRRKMKTEVPALYREHADNAMDLMMSRERADNAMEPIAHAPARFSGRHCS
jgi:hypothetical protein